MKYTNSLIRFASLATAGAAVALSVVANAAGGVEAATQATGMFDKALKTICTGLEQGRSMFALGDGDLYIAPLPWRHNFDPPGLNSIDAEGLRKVMTAEYRMDDRLGPGFTTKLVRCAGGGDTVVATQETTGIAPDASPIYAPRTVIFTVTNGHVSRVEIWEDTVQTLRFRVAFWTAKARLAAPASK